MLVASTSEAVLNGTLKRQIGVRLLSPSSSFVPRKATTHLNRLKSAALPSRFATFSLQPPRILLGTTKYSTSAYTQAQPNAATLGNIKSGQKGESSSESNREDQFESDPDEPPKKATIRERLRFLTRRYGWWALAVYLLASVVDFSLVFASIHLLGTDHIRDLENRFRKYIGMGKRELEDHEVAAWPVPLGAGVTEGSNDSKQINNAETARVAAKRVQRQEDVDPTHSNATSSSSSSSSSSGNGTLWTEALLAYTIHKTLLLPFRVGVTAAITPSFVKYMVKLGWAKDNAAVQKAAHKVKMARDAVKAKAKQASPPS